MNPDTRVAVCCYAGDAFQVIEMLDLYRHHECPITVFSPEDSRADVRTPGVDSLFGGKRAYIGQECLDRMRIHLAMLLDYDENHFLIHDADSICLSPKLPDYLYAEPDVVWSNIVNNTIPWQVVGFPAGSPHVAFQPPWFLSRKTIAALLKQPCVVNEHLPFIDYWMLEATLAAGLEWRGLPDAISAPLSHDNERDNTLARRLVRENGLIFLHSVKGEKHARPLIEARKEFLSEH